MVERSCSVSRVWKSVYSRMRGHLRAKASRSSASTRGDSMPFWRRKPVVHSRMRWMVQPSVSELDEAAADDISGEPVCDSSNGIEGYSGIASGL